MLISELRLIVQLQSARLVSQRRLTMVIHQDIRQSVLITKGIVKFTRFENDGNYCIDKLKWSEW